MKPGNNIQTIIWDWNGTLLDDVDICITSINIMLDRRGLPLIGRERYRTLFTFPVINYYQSIGFDFTEESFETISDEFMGIYFENIRSAKLVQGAVDVLQAISLAGLQQTIISAMRQKDLDASVFRYGIRSYFDGIYGAKDHFAYGKIEHAKIIFHAWNHNPENVLVIGDTCHDAELAAELRCQCILFSGGHYIRQRLELSQCLITDSMKELENLIIRN